MDERHNAASKIYGSAVVSAPDGPIIQLPTEKTLWRRYPPVRFFQSEWWASNPDGQPSAALPALMLRLASSSMWLVFAGVASQGAMLISNVLVANRIGVRDFGVFSLMQTTFATFAVCTQLGFGVVLPRYIALNRAAKGEISRIVTFAYCVVLAVSIMTGLVLAGFANPIAIHFFNSPGLARVLPFAVVAIPLMAVAYVQQAVLNGMDQFSAQAKAAVSVFPVVVIGPMIGASMYGIIGALIGFVVALTARSAANQWLVLRVVARSRFGELRAHLPRYAETLWMHALPATLGGVSAAIGIWVGNAILVRYNTDGTAYGLYAAAFTIRTLLMFVPAQVMNAMLPLLTHIGATNGKLVQRRLLIANIVGSGVISIAFCSVALFFTTNIMHLFGGGFVLGSSILAILLISTCVEVIYTVAYQDLQSAGKFWISTLGVNAPRDLTFIILALLWVPQTHAIGLAHAWLAAQSVALVLTFIHIWRHGRIAPERRST